MTMMTLSIQTLIPILTTEQLDTTISRHLLVFILFQILFGVLLHFIGVYDIVVGFCIFSSHSKFDMGFAYFNLC